MSGHKGSIHAAAALPAGSLVVHLRMYVKLQVVATDVNADNLAALVNEAPDIRAEVMDVKKSEDVEIVIPGVQPTNTYVWCTHMKIGWSSRHADKERWEDVVFELQIARSEGGLHVLINNAGIFPLGPIELLAEEVRLTCGPLSALLHTAAGWCANKASIFDDRTLSAAVCSGIAWRWRWVRRPAVHVQPDI